MRSISQLKDKVPEEVKKVFFFLKDNGFEAYLVGGCVRDLLLGKNPKDWDITTNADPDQIQAIFKEDSFYENDFGTVGVKTHSNNPATEVIEVTPYRLEGVYKDARRPSHVKFSKSLKDDLKRRDFTVNALAWDIEKDSIIDEFGGVQDLENKLIKAVGDPDKRFKEDALRMLRAIRLAAELGFTVESETMSAIAQNAHLIQKISQERIRDEFLRIINSDTPAQALAIAQKVGLLKYIIPELEPSIGCFQGGVHQYDVFEHLLRSLQHAADKKYNTAVRLAALFHDIAKPATKQEIPGKKPSFHGHEVVGAAMTYKIMERLKMPKDLTKKVGKLVRWHMFFSDPDQITLSAVRRIITKVGKDNIKDLLNLRVCDRVGTGLKKEEPYRLRKYKSMIDVALMQPISVSQLAIDGNELMQETKEKPSVRIRWLLHALLEEVLDDPKKNTKEYLIKRVKELSKLSDEQLKEIGESGLQRQKQEEKRQIQEIARKHGVQI